ncbi:MAG TPA: PAS domain S-box protein [Croceibacterium sp.]|nr:PAS domain S-box protein [Croceibacterium sp.]
MQAQDFFTALVESADVGIVAKDLDGVVITWNPAAERLFGYSSAEMVGQSIRRLLPPDRQNEEDEILARIRAGERIDQFFTRRLRKDGQLLDVQVSISPVRDAAGTIVGASKIARDASALVEARRKLEESERRFRQMADNISQLAWITDAQGKFVWVNQRFEEFSGYTVEDMLEGVRDKLVHPDHVDQVYAEFRRAIGAGEDYEDLFPMRSVEGEYRWFLSRALPIRDAEGNISEWFGTNTDVTEQRENSEQIRLLLHEVNHRSKNMLATVQALARKTSCEDASFIERFERRIAALAVNQDILVRREWREVPLEELVRLQLRFVDQTDDHLRIGGPPYSLSPRAAQIIGMALHELATNSLKYGALSSDEGSVEIGWKCSEAKFKMWWHERGGPPVAEPQRSGFGTMLIRDVPRSSLAASVTMNFEPEGLCWQIEAPAAALSVEPEIPVD